MRADREPPTICPTWWQRPDHWSGWVSPRGNLRLGMDGGQALRSGDRSVRPNRHAYRLALSFEGTGTRCGATPHSPNDLTPRKRGFLDAPTGDSYRLDRDIGPIWRWPLSYRRVRSSPTDELVRADEGLCTVLGHRLSSHLCGGLRGVSHGGAGSGSRRGSGRRAGSSGRPRLRPRRSLLPHRGWHGPLITILPTIAILPPRRVRPATAHVVEAAVLSRWIGSSHVAGSSPSAACRCSIHPRPSPFASPQKGFFR